MSIDCIHVTRQKFCLYWLAGALFVSIAMLGFAPSVIPGNQLEAVPLIAPMGASTMLMLTMPTSAFARPRTVLVANALATGIGLLMPHLFSSVIIASAAAVAMTVAAMGVMRTIHPPSAGLTLFAVSQGALPLSQSLDFLLGGVMSRTVLMIVLAIGLNRLGSMLFSTAGASERDRGPRPERE